MAKKLSTWLLKGELWTNQEHAQNLSRNYELCMGISEILPCISPGPPNSVSLLRLQNLWKDSQTLFFTSVFIA